VAVYVPAIDGDATAKPTLSTIRATQIKRLMMNLLL
jgi:hypothetical protein